VINPSLGRPASDCNYRKGDQCENSQQNPQIAYCQQTSLLPQSTQAGLPQADQSASPKHTMTETTAETTLAETSAERENNVMNVASHRTTQQKPPPLTDREEDLAQEIARHLDGDGHSLGAIRRIISTLGEAIVYRLFDETMEQEEAHKIKTTPGRYFIDLAKRDAARQGIDLGFRQKDVSHG
jgi:DNA-directed RNA polymerase specialized sigma54-like protein